MNFRIGRMCAFQNDVQTFVLFAISYLILIYCNELGIFGVWILNAPVMVVFGFRLALRMFQQLLKIENILTQ